MATFNHYSRRRFISTFSAGTFSAAVVAIPASAEINITENVADAPPVIIDTNVNLLEWPFRKMKYGNTRLLIEKLRRHRITQAWAGNYEAVFSKSINVTNARLAKECRDNGKGMLVPFGAVNPAWPDWEEDIRRCHQEYKMPGIRLYPAYQTYDLTHEDFPKLVGLAAERGLIVQIVGTLEDTRVQHPIVASREITFQPIVDVLKKHPKARVQLLNWNDHVNNELLKKLVTETNVTFDIAWLESTGALGRLIDGNSWFGLRTPVPVDRIMFGSYAPFFPPESALMKLFESPLSLNQMKSVMNINANHFIKQAV
jgi:uncharacterized protein